MIHRLIPVTLGLCLLAAAQGAPAAIVPDKVIPLFNGTDLSPFTTWDRKHGRLDRDHVFTVVERIDDGPAIRISGQHFGG